MQKTPQRQSTKRTSSVPAARTQTSTTTLPMYIGGGIPPIPEKLVHCIQKGNFIDMAELLSANLEIANATDEDHSKVNGHKLQQVTNIMDWIQCFSTYIAVVSCTKPECVVDLVAYLNVIIMGQRSFQDSTGHPMTASLGKRLQIPQQRSGVSWKVLCDTCHVQELKLALHLPA